MITIGLTGGIATGKSEVGKILARKGLPIIDADKVAHQTYLPGAEGFDPVVEAFGPSILIPDGSIHRHALGKLAFVSEESLAKLTRIVWPLTKARIIDIQRELSEKGTKVAVLEAAVLGEAGWEDLTDEIWKVTAAPDNSLTWLMWRGDLTRPEAKHRLEMHKLYDTTRAADVIIENNGDRMDLEKKVNAEFDKFKKRRGIEL